jgi:AcrR family transcriptional regulator
MHADERREEILEVAMGVFAHAGLHGTSTEEIARRAGVSQPYIFRLFGTKKALFLAAVERQFDNVESMFRLAAEREREPEKVMEAMGDAYAELLQDRDQLLLQLHAYAACSDPDVRDLCRARYASLVDLVRELSGAPEEAVQGFFAQGMLLNVIAAMDLMPLLNEEWVACLLNLPPLS